MVLRRPALLVVLLVAFAAAGCGEPQGPSPEGQAKDPSAVQEPADDKSAVKATMKSYLGALADGDGDKACSHLTAAAKQQIVGEIRKLNPELGSASCAEALGTLAESTGASTVREVCGASGGAECERTARKAAKALIADLKNAEIEVRVSGDAATAGSATGPDGFDGQLRKIDGEWLISKFATI